MSSFFSYKHQMFDNRKKLVTYINEVIKELPEYNQLKERLNVTKRCYYHECIGNACRPFVGRSSKDIRKELYEICNDLDVKKTFSQFDIIDKRKKIIYRLIQKRRIIILFLYYYYRFK